MSTTTVTNREVKFIGATGGICLALLKLIEAQFYVNNPFGTKAIAAYLTYVAYIFLGIVIANYFVEKELPPDRLRKNALILGLLAPSLLLALTSPKEDLDSKKFQNHNIPAISETLKIPATPPLLPSSGALPSAWAAPCPKGQILVESNDSKVCVKAERITKRQLEPPFFDALKEALGRGTIPKKYSFVIGKTSDAKAAENFATDINESVLASHKLAAQVVNPEGKKMFYVTIGDPASQDDLVGITNATKAAAIAELRASSSTASNGFAERLLGGRIVETRSLF